MHSIYRPQDDARYIGTVHEPLSFNAPNIWIPAGIATYDPQHSLQAEGLRAGVCLLKVHCEVT